MTQRIRWLHYAHTYLYRRTDILCPWRRISCHWLPRTVYLTGQCRQTALIPLRSFRNDSAPSSAPATTANQKWESTRKDTLYTTNALRVTTEALATRYRDVWLSGQYIRALSNATFKRIVIERCDAYKLCSHIGLQCESKKVAPLKVFCDIFTQYISVKFSYCQFISTHTDQFWSIYLNI